MTAPILLSLLTSLGAIGDESVGMNIHYGSASNIAACAELGVRWVRMDANWFELQPAADRYEWASLDAAVRRANDAGLLTFLTLAYTPDWVPRHGDSDGRALNDVPNASTEWVAFVRAATAHFHALGVTHFGLWNEPNLEQFFEGSAQEYATLIANPGADAVRAECPDCFVLGPDLASVGPWDDYLDDLMGRLEPDTFDIIAHHSYNGFPETGTSALDGDRFFNVLDMRRSIFTRKSLKQILDAHHWVGEVWITETGYRAHPAGDAGKEATQATYYEKVLEEQLARPWYTNTFFYEIDDCGPYIENCDIDGFGVMRKTSAGPEAVFPGDFRLKPVFHALKAAITAHPELSSRPAPAACNDGLDNDGDGRVDLADRGCADAADGDESGEPEGPTLRALRSGGLRVDGDLGEHGPNGWMTLPAGAWKGASPLRDAGDLAVRAAARWDDDGLVLIFEVTDDVHENLQTPENLWQGDSVQLGLDPDRSAGASYDSVDDQEINVALVVDATSTYRFHGPMGLASVVAAVARRDPITAYEVRLDTRSLPGLTLRAGTRMGFSFLVNDADGAGRSGWMEWTPGIGERKEPAAFAELVLEATMDTPVTGGADGGGAGGADGGVGGAGDAGGGSTGGGPTGGDGGAAGGGGAGAVDGGAGPGGLGSAGPAYDDNGCNCDVAGGRGARTAAALDGGLALLGALVLRSLARRRRRPARSTAAPDGI